MIEKRQSVRQTEDGGKGCSVYVCVCVLPYFEAKLPPNLVAQIFLCQLK